VLLADRERDKPWMQLRPQYDFHHRRTLKSWSCWPKRCLARGTLENFAVVTEWLPVID
jgi:hypothetical protein